MKLTSKDMLNANATIINECSDGYADATGDASPYPTHNRHPAYIHGYNNGLRDMKKSPPVSMHQIVYAWNYIVATCDMA